VWLVVVLVVSFVGVSSTAGWPLLAVTNPLHPDDAGTAELADPDASAPTSAPAPGPASSSGADTDGSSPSATMVPGVSAPEGAPPRDVPPGDGLTATSDPCASMPKVSGGTWECTLDEQFLGTSLDRDLWLPQETETSNFHSGPECLVDSPNNISVGDSVLKLTARKEPAPFVCPARKDPFTTQYTGGQVSTYGTFSQAYGRVEVRARFPGMGIAGSQGAIWMWPSDQTKWHLKEEIDIAEVYSKYADRATPFVHYGNSRTNVTSHRCKLANLGHFHTYAVEWTPETLRFIYDGSTCLLHRIENGTSSEPPFSGAFMVALSQFLGRKTNAFHPGKTPLPVSMYVDYVRVWK
jgi:hypothetical protein